MSTYKKQEIVHYYRAYSVVEREPASSGAINLTYGERIRVGTNTQIYNIFTVVGYSLEYNESPIKSYNQAIERGHETIAMSEAATIITNSENERGTVIQVEVGQPVCIEGQHFVIDRERAGRFGLVPLTKGNEAFDRGYENGRDDNMLKYANPYPTINSNDHRVYQVGYTVGNTDRYEAHFAAKRGAA